MISHLVVHKCTSLAATHRKISAFPHNRVRRQPPFPFIPVGTPSPRNTSPQTQSDPETPHHKPSQNTDQEPAEISNHDFPLGCSQMYLTSRDTPRDFCISPQSRTKTASFSLHPTRTPSTRKASPKTQSDPGPPHHKPSQNTDQEPAEISDHDVSHLHI
jgi:hypothetical protein